MNSTETIEKIRAEVNRQRTFYSLNNPYDKRAIRVCNNILSTLGNLEKEEKPTIQEQLVCEGFDGEFSKFSNDVDAEHPFPICVDEYKDFARHFYELGCRRTAEKYDEIEYKRQGAEEETLKDLE